MSPILHFVIQVKTLKSSGNPPYHFSISSLSLNPFYLFSQYFRPFFLTLYIQSLLVQVLTAFHLGCSKLLLFSSPCPQSFFLPAFPLYLELFLVYKSPYFIFLFNASMTSDCLQKKSKFLSNLCIKSLRSLYCSLPGDLAIENC